MGVMMNARMPRSTSYWLNWFVRFSRDAQMEMSEFLYLALCSLFSISFAAHANVVLNDCEFASGFAFIATHKWNHTWVVAMFADQITTSRKTKWWNEIRRQSMHKPAHILHGHRRNCLVYSSICCRFFFVSLVFAVLFVLTSSADITCSASLLSFRMTLIVRARLCAMCIQQLEIGRGKTANKYRNGRPLC